MGIIYSGIFCEALARKLIFKELHEWYNIGWGARFSVAMAIKWKWDLLVEDVDRKQTVMKFDLVEGESAPIIGLEVKRYADTLNRGDVPMIVFRRPND